MFDTAELAPTTTKAPVAHLSVVEPKEKSVVVVVARAGRHAGKRIFDAVLAGVLLAVLGLPLLLVGLAVCLDSKGPALFRQVRTGMAGKPFVIFKFRTMAHVEDTNAPATPNDSRVTRFGAFLRRTSIDELPQLLNVLRGEMSLVGPRPHAMAHDKTFLSSVEGYEQRFRTRPGITGLAQIRNLRGGGDLTEIAKRTEADNEYVDSWSLGLDIRIILGTLAHLFDASPY